MEQMRTGVQRRTLVGALLAAAAIGVGSVALIGGGSDGGSKRISDVEPTSTTLVTTTTEAPSTTIVVTTTAAPATTVAPAQPAPIEQRVEVLEERVDQIEETTTTVPAAPVTTAAPPPSPCAPEDVNGCRS